MRMIAYAHVWMCVGSMDVYGCLCSSMHVHVCMHVYEYACRCVSGICPTPAPIMDMYVCVKMCMMA